MRLINNGRVSEAVYNEKLTHINKTLEDINTPIMNDDPQPNYEGKLWVDKHSGNQMKVSRNGAWDLCFKNEIQILSQIGNESEPTSPVNTQLWVDDGILKYYDQTEGFKPVKADTSGAGAMRSFADFIYNSAHAPAGQELTDTILEPSEKYYQYLTPSAPHDKVFLSQGFLVDEEREDHPTIADKEVIATDGKKTTSDVSFELRQNFVSSEQVNTVHVNPVRLNKIKRKTLALSGLTKNFTLKHDNTEFYGIKNGTGLFLRENIDYTTSPYGITLLHPESYDFLHIVEYEFISIINSPGDVEVIKGKTGSELKIPLGYILPLVDFPKLAVFVGGLYLDENHIMPDNSVTKNYELDDSRKFIKVNNMNGLNSLTAVAVLMTERKYSSIIPTRVGNTGKIPISSIPETFVNPIIFVNGIEGFKPADYTITDTDYEVEGITEDNMEFVIIDVDEDNTGTSHANNMIIQSGVTDNSGFISFDENLLPDNINAQVWCNGILISHPDLDRDNIAHNLTFEGITEGLDYLILRDPLEKMIINKYISPSALFSNNISDAVVYSDNFLLMNPSDLFSPNLAEEKAFEGEVKNYANKFYYYNPRHEFSYIDPSDNLKKSMSLTVLVDNKIIRNDSWYLMSSVADNFITDIDGETVDQKNYRQTIFNLFKDMIQDKLTKIKEAQTGYTVNTTYVDIINGIDDQNITAYCYRYTNNISKPLQVGHIQFDMNNPNNTEYLVGLKHSYENGINGVSLYINGFKQYENVEKGDAKTIVLPEPIGIDTMKEFFDNNPEDYQAWKDRTGNTSYTPKNPITDMSYVLEGLETGETYAALRTILGRKDRVPGTINTYKSDISLFPGKITVFLGGLRVPKESVKILSSNILMLDVKNNISGTDLFDDKINREDKLLVEVRNDYNIKELTIPVEYAGQTTYSIPNELANAKDTILIYINGVFYGSDYIIDKLNNKLTITNNSLITALLGHNINDDGIEQPNINSNLEKFYIENPEKRKEYEDYNPNYITFEWR